MSRREVWVSLVALVLALLVGAVFILVAHKSPILAYTSLFKGAFSSADHIADTLNRTAPLILTGLAVSFAFRGGLFNIGGEGQYLLGGFAAVWAGFTFKSGLPIVVHLPLALLCGAVVGGLYGAVPALLKARFGVHEVISTIMLNFIGKYAVSYLVTRVFLDQETRNGTPRVAATAVPPHIFGDAHAGIVIALACAFAVWFILYRTTLGYEVKAVGHAPLAAEYGGIGITRTMVTVMAISGALAGLAGAVDYPTITGRFPVNVEFRGLGFDGIAVALIGRNEPVGVVLAALLFGALSAGQPMMQSIADIPKEITLVVQACIILFMVAPGVVRGLVPWGRGAASKPAEPPPPGPSGAHLPPSAPHEATVDPGGVPL